MRPQAILPTTLFALFPYFSSCWRGGKPPVGGPGLPTTSSCCLRLSIYSAQQKHMTIWQNRSEWNRWHGEFVLERTSSKTQSISVAMGRWSVQHRAFAVETYFKNNDSLLTQRIFCQQFNIHQNKCL
jgi:hypothetical protein